ALTQFLRERSIDQRNRRQERQSRSQRKGDGARQAARPAHAGKCKSKLRAARAADACRKFAEQRAGAPEKREHRDEAETGQPGDQLLLGQKDRGKRKSERRQSCRKTES